uniref:Aquaporin 10b n=1 Tax=Hucho hucho TaxID=62062 RepID=A0A4W5KE50_9TELE
PSFQPALCHWFFSSFLCFLLKTGSGYLVSCTTEFPLNQHPQMWESPASFSLPGAHVNPAVSLAMVILGKLQFYKFPVYVIAQFLGAFAGAAAVFGLYYGEYYGRLYSIQTIKLYISMPIVVLLLQVVGTGMLVLCILAIIDGKNIGAPRGMEPLCIGLVIMAIGVSMGLNCGYPLNPARDLGPRLFTAVAGWGWEVFSTADYWWWVPVVGPMLGGVVGALVYFLFIEMHHKELEKPQEEEEEEEEEEEKEEDEGLEEDSSLKDKYEMITMS